MPWVQYGSNNGNQSTGGGWIPYEEKLKIDTKRKQYENSMAEANKYQQQALVEKNKEMIWQGIADIPKTIFNAAKESAAIGADIVSRLSPVETVRNIASGIGEAVSPENKSAGVIENYKTGFYKSQARPLMYENATGQSLPAVGGGNLIDTTKNVLLNKEYRKAIGRAMEIPTYFYSGAKGLMSEPTGNLLMRLGKRTVGSIPIAGVQTGIQKFEGDSNNIVTSFAGNLASMSAFSNLFGEIGRKFGRSLTPGEEKQVVNAVGSGADADTLIKNIETGEPIKTPKADVETKINQIVGTPEKNQAITPNTENITRNSIEDVRTYINNPETGLKKKTIDSFRRSGIVGDIKFDENGNTTLYRSGKALPGKPQSYSKRPMWEGQKPVEVNRKNIVLDTTAPEFKDLYKKHYNTTSEYGTSELEGNLYSLDMWNKHEAEVIAITPGAKKSGGGFNPNDVVLSGKGSSISPVIERELGQETNLPTTSIAGEMNKADSFIATNDIQTSMKKALYGGDTDNISTTMVNRRLADSAGLAGNEELRADLVMARAANLRRMGQEIVMERGSLGETSSDQIMKRILNAKMGGIDTQGLSLFDKAKAKISGGSKVASRVSSDAAQLGKEINSKITIRKNQIENLLNSLECK